MALTPEQATFDQSKAPVAVTSNQCNARDMQALSLMFDTTDVAAVKAQKTAYVGDKAMANGLTRNATLTERSPDAIDTFVHRMQQMDQERGGPQR